MWGVVNLCVSLFTLITCGVCIIALIVVKLRLEYHTLAPSSRWLSRNFDLALARNSKYYILRHSTHTLSFEVCPSFQSLCMRACMYVCACACACASLGLVFLPRVCSTVLED
jgi:hypothetical protein